MADDDIDIEGEFDFKTEAGDGFYDANELPSKSANLLPEYTNPPWMLEQGWSLDNCIDEKSKATIERMLMEEQYINGHKKGQYLGINKSLLLITSPPKSPKARGNAEASTKKQWTEEEKKLFLKGLELFGRSWSKISRLIPSRTTVQVKNYAQQFMKNQAKKAEQQIASSTDVAVQLLPAIGGDTATVSSRPKAATSSSSSATLLMRAAEAVCTGAPTVLSRPRASLLKVKSTPNCVVPKKSFSNGTGQKTAQRQALDHAASGDGSITQLCFDDPVSILPVSNLPNGHKAVFSDFDQGKPQEKKNLVSIITIKADSDKHFERSSSSSLTENKLSKADESDDDEIDIDIENDDSSDDNSILQSRSASPSSVYHRLLEQAKVTAAKRPDDEDHPVQESEIEEGSPSSVPDSDASNVGGNSNESWTQSSDVKAYPSAVCPKHHTSASLASDDSNGRADDKVDFAEETKLIVNGVVASNGEVFEFPIPIEARELQPDQILEEETRVHAEFFDGRPLKTPERYLKIRNYILDCWKKSHPSYLNKTSVRPGLKNCGDVNCIGRIHAYLECIGAINFGCEQAAYNNPGRSTGAQSKSKCAGKDYKMFISAAKLEAMRPRKRRIRDASGLWVDKRELEGKTIEHQPEKDEASPNKNNRGPKIVYDPFKLVPCQPFSEEKQAPYRLEIVSTALAVMDIHAHISRTEVIGMLGGHFDLATSSLTVSMAVPCKSISTGMQCEMDPVSQTHASEQIEDVGMQVVGWYHSHPTFAPNPSVRDIETQQKFQYWFAKGGSHFVGLIISPYSPQNVSVISDVRCLTIGDEIAREYLCNMPYQLRYKVAFRDNLREILGPASELAEKYSNYNSRVALSCVYKSSLGITCLSKMLQSVKHHLEPPDPEDPIPGSRRKVEDVLHWLEQIFLEKFSTASITEAPLLDSVLGPAATPVPPTDDGGHV